MLIERLVLKEGADERVYILADWSIAVEGHWVGNDFLRHKKLGARESCCEKYGRSEQFYIIPALPLNSKRVKMLYLTRAEYDNLSELMDNVDVKVSPVKIKSPKEGAIGFVLCSDEENGVRIRGSVGAVVDLLHKEDLIDKVTWPGIKYNDI